MHLRLSWRPFQLSLLALVLHACDGPEALSDDASPPGGDRRLILDRIANLDLPTDLSISSVAWSEDGRLLLWSPTGRRIWEVDGKGSLIRSALLPMAEELLAVSWQGKRIVVVGRVFGRLSLLDEAMNVEREDFLWSTPDESPYQLVAVGERWVGIRDATPNTVGLWRYEEGRPPKQLAELAAPRPDALYRKEGARAVLMIAAGHHDGAIAVATKWPPFSITVRPSDTKACAHSFGVWQTLSFGQERDTTARWIGVSLVDLRDEWLLVASDLRSNRRQLLRIDRCGVLRRASSLEQPFGVIATNPALRELIGVSRDSSFNYSLYRWRWAADPASHVGDGSR